MDYAVFVKKAVALNGRNKFESYEGNIDIVPDEIKPFYRNYNPVHVEIGFYGVSISFCPANDLLELQKEYTHINVQLIFATCNSDPIFINNGCVYTCAHGVHKPQHEKIADSFIEYLTSLVD